MSLNQCYKTYRDRWWALPLVLPFILLPVIRLTNTFTQLDGGLVALYYMPLALMIVLMLFFGLAALPGMALAQWFWVTRYAPAGESVAMLFHFLIPVVISWGGYRVFAPRRNMVSHGNARLMAARMFWQAFVPATLFQLLFQLAIYLGLLPSRATMAGVDPLTLRALINYQALLVGCLTGVPFCYLLIRIIRNPRHLRGFISQTRLQFDPKVKWQEMVVWSLVLFGLLALLFMPIDRSSTIFSTNYTLSLLLPVMLWGAMRFGYRFMSLVWSPVLMMTIHFYYRYLPVYPGYNNQLAITSSSYLVFSFIVIYMAMLATRQRQLYGRMRRMAFFDPVVHMPNLRALGRALGSTPWSVICFLRIPELELLGRHYGVLVRIQYKQRIADWLRDWLRPGECVYQLSGHDLVLRLNTEDYQARIGELDNLVKQFRFIWDGMPLQPNIGISYCYVRSPVNHLHLLLGELSTIADLSLTTNHPESLQRRGAMHLQQALKEKVAMMNRLQQALEKDRFRLLAQRIEGSRGDDYYEVLLQLDNGDGEPIEAAEFLPVACEFGLSSRIDLWVLEHALRFMDRSRQALPGLRLAINLSISSPGGSRFYQEVERLLAYYRIEGWQLIFEVAEDRSLNNPEQALLTIEQLQRLGCRIAIDDFGASYASYARLQEADADMVKVSGRFIRNIVASSLDYQLVAAIRHLARMKKMHVVAECVENEETRAAALALGIDYLQGSYIGRPEPLAALAAAPPAETALNGDFR